MALKLDLNITNDVDAKIDTKNLTHLVEDFLVYQKLDGNWYLEIAFVDEAAIQKFNKQHRNIDKPTDVLSFPIALPQLLPTTHDQQPMTSLGSIVICPHYAEVKKRSSIDTADPYTLEIPDLVVHGLMHLLGKNHETDTEHARWEKTIQEFWLRTPRR